MSGKSKVGMYAITDPNYPQIKVGEFTICRQDESSVWIQTEKGEGASFSDALFGEAIKSFFDTNF